MSLALAIQGVGGRNNFNQGVLYAFRRANIKPDMMSVTSGALISLYHYLDPDVDVLRRINSEDSKHPHDKNHSPFKMFDYFQHMYFGKPGVFKTVNPWFNMMDMFFTNATNPFLPDFFRSWSDLLFPAQLFESTRPDSFFIELANRINQTNIGIISNAYNYKTGKTVVYVNPSANNKLSGTRFNIQTQSEYDVREIDAEGLKACLHLIQYGAPYNDQYDGAYQYNPFIPPLKICENILVVSAVPVTRQPKPIKNYFDAETFKIKMWLNNALYAECSTVNLINQLIDEKMTEQDHIHRINLKILEPSIDIDFFDFFVDNPQLFNDGLKQAKKKISKHLKQSGRMQD